MKKILLILFILFANVVFAELPLKITPDFSNRQIRKIEKKALKEFGVKVKIEVFSRNSAGLIEKVKISRFRNDIVASSCSSDNFEEMEITKGGCWIKDKTTDSK